MRCTRIKQHLSDPDSPLTPQLTEHMHACRDCRDAWEAELAVRRSISAVRDERPARMGTADAWVDRVASHEEESFVSSIVRHPLGTRGRRWGWTLSLLTAALAVFVLVPFSYEHTIGTEITIPTSSALLQKVDVSAIEARLADRWSGSVQVAKFVDNNGALLKLNVPGSTNDALAVVDAASDLLPVPLAGANIELAPWRVRESGSLLAQISSTFTVSVNVEGKSESQIADEIRAQLETQGMQVDNLWISKDGNQTTMTLEGGVPGTDGEQTFEVHLLNDDASGGQEFTSKIMIEDLDPNMTDAEKVEAVKKRLAEEGIYDADVQVTNGEIKIELQKDK